MDFQLNKFQSMTINSMREFVRKEVMPVAQELDEKAEFPLDSYRKAADLGILDMTLPLEMGGSGADYLSFAIALEEFACGSAALANSIAMNEMVVHLLEIFGTEDQQKKYMAPLVNAQIIGAVALDNMDDAEAANQPLRAVADGNGYLVNGSMRYIANAPIADLVIFFAGTADGKILAFAVEKNLPGLALGKSIGMMGQRSLPVGGLIFHDVRIPLESRIGKDVDGLIIINACLNRMRIFTGAVAVGISQAAMEEAARYSQQRIQFKKTLASFEAIQNKIADMASGVEAARLLVYQAAALTDQKKKSEKQSSIAKVFASDLAVAAGREAVQIHGGYGYVKDYTVERLYRDALFTQIYNENNETQRFKIARRVFNEYK